MAYTEITYTMAYTEITVHVLHRKKLILVEKWPYATKNVPDKINSCFIAGIGEVAVYKPPNKAKS